MITAGGRSFVDADDLEKLVIHAATEYELHGYVEDFDGQEITDPQYDDLYKTLKKIKPKSDAFAGTSPSKVKPKGHMVKHDPPMTSIHKADGDLEEKKAIYVKWMHDCANDLGKKPNAVIFCQSYKRDGVALRINYVDGKLVSAGLRPRDGINGSDVTRHMKYIEGVPLKLPHPHTLSLNGEIECWMDDFALVNKAQDDAGEEIYKNPRNYTAGCLGRDDPEENKDARLRIAFYSITGFNDWRKYYKTEVERAKWANNKDNGGLNLQNDEGKGYFIQMLVHKVEDLKPGRNNSQLHMMEEHAKKRPYYVDGVVLKINDLEDQEELGHTGDDPVNPPRGALAWKFAEELAEAEVSSIEWNASRTGRIVPTAIFDTPFTLADTDNSRATANNYGWMESQGLGPGAKVRCKKGGKIIPNICEVLVPVKDIGAPTHCPTCQGKLVVETSPSGNKDLMCHNDDCGAKHVKGWIFYIQMLGGKGLGSAAMEQILGSGKVRHLSDLYKLTMDDLTAVGFSERQALLALATIFRVAPINDDVKLARAIKEARTKKQSVPAWQFFASLGIPQAGKTAGKALMQHFRSFEEIMDAKLSDLTSIPGIGNTTAENIIAYFGKRRKMVEELLDKYVELELPKTGKFSGTNFVLTGAFTQGKSFWETKIQEQGGNISGSVGKSTNYLVQELGKTDGSPSEKEKKAANLGVKIISVKELEKML
jgi:DNA ligase (NAD+)